MFKERSTRARLGGSGLGGRGGRRRAVRAARPRGNNPKPLNAIRWLQFVVIGIGIFKSSVLVAAGSGNCFAQQGSDFKLNGACINGKVVLNVGDHPELNFNMDFGSFPKNVTVNQVITLKVGGRSMTGTVIVNQLGSKHFLTGVKLKGKDDSDFKQVVKGSASFDKTWIGYKTSVEYMGKANLTALSFEFLNVKEYDASKDKMPNYILFSIIGGGLLLLLFHMAKIKATTYEGRVQEAKQRAEFLGVSLPEDRKLHQSFVENRAKPKSKKYSVDANAPLKPVDEARLCRTAKAWSPLMDKTQEESVRTAVEEFRSKVTAVELGHPLVVDPKYAVIVHLLSLPRWWQRFDFFFDMPTTTVISLIKEALEQLEAYRNTFAETSQLRDLINEDIKDVRDVAVVAEQVEAVKCGKKKFRLPYSYDSAEEFGMMLHCHIIYAACNEPIDNDQLKELERIIVGMKKRLKQLKKPVIGEMTAKRPSTDQAPRGANTTKLQARAILLEQFNKGVNDPQVALKAVLKELGPKSMSKTSATLWFNRFRKNDFSLGTGASKADQKLIGGSKFLTTKRALFCEMSNDGFYFTLLETTGTNGRFQFFTTSPQNSRSYGVLDTFHGQKKELILDASELRYQSPTTPNFNSSRIWLKQVHFIDDEKCLLIFGNPQSCMVSATFDMKSCTMKLGEYRHLADTVCYTLFADSQSVGLLEEDRNTLTTHYMDVNLKDDLKFENRLDLESTLYLKYATRRNGMLVGFDQAGWPINLNSLIAISLTDGSVSKRPTNWTEEGIEARSWPGYLYVWIKDKLFTYFYPSSNDSMNSIYVFDLGTLEWNNTGIQLGGRINYMSSADDKVLIVNVMKSFRSNCREVYRFSIFGPDSLINLSWMAARRRAQFEPEFYDQTLQKLPTNCHLRCPWQNDSQSL
ncbi:hypothetical protein M3Y94_00102400 [Aphelenchoides besseyi]|nr:hypothetical protein M3Y94_00102400 [Aphelenchoides besseyi]